MPKKHYRIFAIPAEFGVSIIKDSGGFVLYAYSSEFATIFVAAVSNRLWVDVSTGTVGWDINKCVGSGGENPSSKRIEAFFFVLNHLWFKKIKFKGKGWKLRSSKKAGVMRLVFGRSHITYILVDGVFLKKLGKYKFALYGKNHQLLCDGSKTIRLVRPINSYTKRGLRQSRELFLKRRGKVSSFI